MDDADRGKLATIYIVAYLPYDKLLVSSDQELFLTQHFTNPVLVIYKITLLSDHQLIAWGLQIKELLYYHVNI